MSEGEGEGRIISIPAGAKQMGVIESTFLLFSSCTLFFLSVGLPILGSVLLIKKFKEYGLAFVLVGFSIAIASGNFIKVYLLSALCTAYFIPYLLLRLSLRGIKG